jgi:hypothetical protein
LNGRLEKLERNVADSVDETDFVMLEMGPGWDIKIPAKVAPQVFQNIENIYGQGDGSGESMAA